MRSERWQVYMETGIILVAVVMMTTGLWYNHVWADEARPEKVLTVPPGTRRSTHTPTPIGQLPTATIPSTATSIPIETLTATSIPTVTPTITPAITLSPLSAPTPLSVETEPVIKLFLPIVNHN